MLVQFVASKRATVEAVCFFLASVITIIASSIYSKEAVGNRELSLLLLAVVVSIVVYLIRSPHGTFSKRTDNNQEPSCLDAVKDILLMAGIALGSGYRLNIMKPTKHADVTRQYFVFICQIGMANVHLYGDRIRLSTRGVGEAYLQRQLVYLPPAQIDDTIDPWPKHIWSINIEEPGEARSVLNIDTNKESITPEEKRHIEQVITKLSTTIAKYKPAQQEAPTGGVP